MPNAKYTAILAPLWIIHFLVITAHVKLVSSMPATEDDENGANMRRDVILDALSYTLFAVFNVLVALNLDGFINVQYSLVFIPYFLWEALKLRSNIKTIEQAEKMRCKAFDDLTAEDLAAFMRSPQYKQALLSSRKAKRGILWLFCRATLAALTCVQFDDHVSLRSWHSRAKKLWR